MLCAGLEEQQEGREEPSALLLPLLLHHHLLPLTQTKTRHSAPPLNPDQALLPPCPALLYRLLQRDRQL
jgi:hypothetical protein